MPDDGRKMNRQSTGTVPKAKCRNTPYLNERDSGSWTNNWAPDSLQCSNVVPDYLRNSRRNLSHQQSNFTGAMNTCMQQDQGHPSGPLNTAIGNTSASRRNSSGTSTSTSTGTGTTPKCDNVTKYPDKRQVEDRLKQIQKYLQITTSLMSSMKNADDQLDHTDEIISLGQMAKDLTDSEQKLVTILKNTASLTDTPDRNNGQASEDGLDNTSDSGLSSSHKNDLDDKVDHTNREIELLRDQQMTLLSLQQKAENKLRDARQIQEKLSTSQYGTDMNSAPYQTVDKNFSPIDAAIRQLEERSKIVNEPRGPSSSNVPDRLLADVDALHNQIITLHSVNEDRNQLIHALDNRDMELKAQHVELQTKLTELQNRKTQVDHLVSQLHELDASDDEDVGGQVRRIMTMKDQLARLKDMLELVKTTETVMQNTNSTQEEQELACMICAKAENLLLKDDNKCKPHTSNDSLRYDNAIALNENRHKQVNKNAVDRQGAKPKIKTNSNKMTLQAELEAKKRELEDIMGKHKAGPSNLNHDVGNDTKSEFSCSSNMLFDTAQVSSWPPPCDHNRPDSCDKYSSDECAEDVNEYQDLHGYQNQSGYTMPLVNYPRSGAKLDRQRCDQDYYQDQDRQASLTRTPERNTRSNSVAPGGARHRSRSNTDQDKNKIKKHLELIRSVCDSMLEQNQASKDQQSNVQQLRNNLTPSPLYSEPRRFASPNPHSMNALNVLNPLMESPWSSASTHGGHSADPGGSAATGYQNWLTTNTLQTQAFMLNTLNQCCQMLWLQQRELMNLRQTVTQLQEGIDNTPLDNSNHLAPPLQPVPVAPRPSSNQHRSNQKANQVSSACSMPNLNQYSMPSINIDPSHYPNSYNNMQNARILESCLNNANLSPMQNGDHIDHINNSVLHGAANVANHQHQHHLNQPLPNQMWNGQALNNQVAPGNRANNYWDNFRSYSRQNLLSNKSNDGGGIQNAAVSSTLDRTNPFTMMYASKSNSDQNAAAFILSQENTPPRSNGNRSNSVNPPDVLNINHNLSKSKEQHQADVPLQNNVSNDNESNHQCYHMYLNNAYNETSSNTSNISEDLIFKDCVNEHARMRNEWHEEPSDEQYPKSKLFEELRENVYKEVVSLITLNEARPHFLIQLFRDLQMISSDPLRLKILQSIQSIITNSLISSQSLNRVNLQPADASQVANDALVPEGFSLQSTVWSSKETPNNQAFTPKNRLQMDADKAEIRDVLAEAVIPYLSSHEDDDVTQHFLIALKQKLIESESFHKSVRDAVFKKHFANVLDDVLMQYFGSTVKDVKIHVIQTISDVLRAELSFIQLIQDSDPRNNESSTTSEIVAPWSNNHPGHVPLFVSPPTDNNGTLIQNGDLAEADQGHAKDDDTDEEGAVGFWNLQFEPNVEVPPANAPQMSSDEAAPIDAETHLIKQGLDQVPTRLPTRSPSKGDN